MKRILYHTAAVLLLLPSCTVKWEIDDNFEPQIAIEGWIDSGKPAKVIVSQMLPYGSDTEGGALDMKNIPVRWATVSLSDGENEEILVGQIDANYTPPYIYTGSSIIGQPGRTYTLTVKYSGKTLVSSTTVPDNVPVERVETEKSPSCDTLYGIRIYFKDNPDEKNWYKVFTQVKNTDKRYFSAFMGDISDEVLGEDAFITVNRAFRHTRYNRYTPYFNESDTVYVKFAQVPESGFEFWSSYENEVTNGANILFPNTGNLKSNIDGGRGIWCGYGVDIVEVKIKDAGDRK